MAFLFAAAVCMLIAALVLRAKHPQRALAVAIAGVAVGVAAGALSLLEQQSPAPPAIAREDVTLIGPAVAADRYGAQLRGQARNASRLRLGTLTLAVVYRECPQPEVCTDLGSEEVRVFMALAAGQTGGFSALLTRADLASRPGVRADVSVTSAQADF